MPKTKRKSQSERLQKKREVMKKLRQDTEYRASERIRNAKAHALARQDPEFRTPEKARDAKAHASARQDPEFRTPEKARDAKAHASARQDPEFRTPEKARDAKAHASARQDPEFLEKDRASNAVSHASARQDPEFRTPEKARDAKAHASARQDPEYLELERTRNAAYHAAARENRPFDKLKALYLKEIRQKPDHTCVCCGRMLFEHQVNRMHATKLQDLDADFLSKVICPTIRSNDTSKMTFCSTCKTSVSKGRVPRLCLSNGFDFPDIPVELQGLTELEERLVAARIPFMQIRQPTYDGQLKLHGSIVNVESDLGCIANNIPRAIDDTATIQVRLKRRLRYNRPYLHATIRPWNVHRAGSYLVKTELYQANKIGFVDTWENYNQDETVPFDTSPAETAEEISDQADQQDDEDTSEDKLHGANDTLLHNQVDFSLCDENLDIAPGEGKTPLALQLDIDAEELSFPTIYGGKRRNFNKNLKISYTDICKSELLRHDPRACVPTKVLYSFKKSFNEKVYSQMQIYLRKARGKEQNYKASQIRDPKTLKEIIKNDEGYAVWKNLRSSPSYWAAKSKKTVAMVRQLGRCTFFITLSAAEKKWPELLVALHKRATNEDITEEEAMGLLEEDKNKLIRNDPVLCMKHFDIRYKAFMKYFIKAANGIFGPEFVVLDFFVRQEFQMRGSPHMHGVFWLAGASGVDPTPKYVEGDEESERACTEFVDKFITCSRDVPDEMLPYLAYQVHAHSNTCRKKVGKKKCRFGFPKPPLPSTVILQPLSPNTKTKVREIAKTNWQKVEDALNKMGRNPTDYPTVETFLSDLNLTKNEYLLAIRSTLKRGTVFLKRSVGEAFVSSYNLKMLECWKANLDIQFVLDTYACAKYCVGYMMKGNGGISKTLRLINQSAASNNEEIFDKLKASAKLLWIGTEISAQEAAGFLLGMNNVDCSRSDVFVNTSPPHERTYILKPKEELSKLEDDEESVVASGLLDHYSNRSTELEDKCLAEIATMFEYQKAKTSKKNDDDDYATDANESTGVGVSKYYKMLDETGFLRTRPRAQRKILRFRHYSEKKDPDNFWRERLMLFLPWRDEDSELNNLTPEQLKLKYLENNDEISENSQHYFGGDTDEDGIRALVEDQLSDDEDESDEQDEDFREIIQEQIDEAERALGFDPKTGEKVMQFLPPKQVDNDEYLRIMRSLNDKQRRIVLDVLHRLKTSADPFYIFLSGGAGVGKSHTITAVVQSILRLYGEQLERNQSEAPVIVSAFTGKAAFNVSGMTLHTTYRFPPSQELAELEAESANSLRVKFAGVKLFIIDEISMTSFYHLQLIDLRLRQVFKTNRLFGGKSFLVVGHLRQLPPIGGKFVFTRMNEQVNPFWNLFNFYELDEIMRQRGEFEFCKALNAMSECQMDELDVQLIKTREISDRLNPPEDAIRLFKTNKECEDYNSSIHSRMITDGMTSTARDKVEGKVTSAKRRRVEQIGKTLSIGMSDGLRYTVNLKVGGKYFISTNIDVQDGLFNGATGTLMFIEKVPAEMFPGLSEEERIIRAWMEFEKPSVGSARRAAFFQMHPNILLEIGGQPSWTPIDKFSRTLKYRPKDGLRITRSQIPLVACNGMTIAKSQGSSLSTVVVNVKGRKLDRAELYVACSRATSINGLFIDGEFTAPSPLEGRDVVGEEMERLRSQKTHPLSINFMQDSQNNVIKLYFHNIQSFGAHWQDLVVDACPMSSDIIALVEPHLLHNDPINVPDFKICLRADCRESRKKSDGVILLAKDAVPVLPGSVCRRHVDKNGYSCYFTKFIVASYTVVVIYKHPDFSNVEFLSVLENYLDQNHQDTIYIGDFNIDICKPENRAVIETFGKYGLHFLLPVGSVSTNRGTCIDLCFGNVVGAQAFWYESYYSIHKPICVYLLKNY